MSVWRPPSTFKQKIYKGPFKLTSSVPYLISLEGPLYIFILKVLGGLQTDMITLPSYQFKGPLIFPFTKICSYLIGDLATDKYYIVLLVYSTCQLYGPLLKKFEFPTNSHQLTKHNRTIWFIPSSPCSRFLTKKWSQITGVLQVE